MDTVDKETRSQIMAAIRSEDTKPEMALRRSLFRLGYRYRLHQRGLPGKPDMVFSKYGVVVFVNGCFWHHHECLDVKMPETQRAWWRKKLDGNRKRDVAVLKALHEMGWRTVVVWECSIRRTKDLDAAMRKVAGQVSRFLRSKRKMAVISGR
jgi:DNA mismatch endonuclease (patch repair protein)